MRVKALLAVVLFLGFVSPALAAPITIVNTGPGPAGSTSGWILAADQYLAARFTVTSAVTVTSLEGWIFAFEPGLLTVELASDGGDVPGSVLFTADFNAAGSPGWLGVTGISQPIGPGTYWIVFGAPEASLGGGLGAMPYPSGTPLANEAVWHPTAGWSGLDGYLNLGVRILGDDAAPEPVPDPASTLLLLGMGLSGLVAARRR